MALIVQKYGGTSVGSIDRMHEWGKFDLDTRFENQVLMPGLVEGHSHLMAGALWQFTYCGAHDARDHGGRHHHARHVHGVVPR